MSRVEILQIVTICLSCATILAYLLSKFFAKVKVSHAVKVSQRKADEKLYREFLEWKKGR